MEDMPTEPLMTERDPSFIKGMLIPWTICLLAATFYFYDFFLRVTPSVMIHPLMQQFHVGATEIGFISAFYYYAYTPLQIPSGVVVDRYSIRMVLTLSALCCALGALIFATFINLPAAFVGRAMMGIGSAFAFIGSLKLAALWLPERHFALYAGIATALGTIGAISADVILSRIVHHLGWRQAVYITAYIGLGLAVLLFIAIRNRPSWVVRMPRSYRSWGHTWVRVFLLLKNWRFWALGLVGAFLFLPVSVFASLWGVAFITQAYKLHAMNGAAITSLLFIGSAIGFPIAGWVSDKIQSRRKPIFVSIIMVFILSLLLIYTPHLPFIAALALLFLMGLFIGPQVLIFAIAREMSPPRSTGISTAVSNFLVTIGAAVFQPLIGYLLELHWQGATTAGGMPTYSLSNYHFALIVLPATLIVAFLLLFVVPKTHCRMLYEQTKHFQDYDEEE